MAGKRRTLWRGTLYLGNDRGGAEDDKDEEDEEDEEELSIAITTHQPSMMGEETFDWVERRDEASLTRCPRSCLRETHDIRPYIRNSQSVEVIEYSGRLKKLLEGNYCAVLSNEQDRVTPLLLILDPSEDIVVGLCVDFPAGNRTEQDRQILLEGFNTKIEENISRLPPRATQIPDPTDIPDRPEVAEAKRRMVDTYLANIEFVEPVLKFGHNKFRYLRHAEWRMNCHEEDLAYLSIFVQSEGKEEEKGRAQEQGKELIIFCQASSSLPLLLERLQQEPPTERPAPTHPATVSSAAICGASAVTLTASTITASTTTATTMGSTTSPIPSQEEEVDIRQAVEEVDQRQFLVEAVSSVQGLLSHPGLEESQVVRLVEDLSSFEEHFLRMGRKEVCPVLMIEADQLQSLFSQFEVKHGSSVMVIPKLDRAPPYISCIVTSEDTSTRLQALAKEVVETGEKVETNSVVHIEKLPCNPDEIIDGRPKWSKIRQLRKRKLKKTANKDNSQEEGEEELVLNFDRLNPHRMFITELDESFENKGGEYQKVALKMLADLQVDTFVPIGDSRLGQEAEEKARKEMEEWEEFKVKYSYVGEEKVEQQACQRKKTGGKVKINNKRSILAKTMRKITT